MRLKKWIIAGLAMAVGVSVLYVAFGPSWVRPVAWTPSPNPGWTGVFSADSSGGIDFETFETGKGPEDVALGPDGWLYTGLEDGRIVRLGTDGTGEEDFARTGGRPLGVQFDAHGDLIVADARRGLLRVGPDRAVDLLTDRADGIPIRFADDLDIASDGTVLFSDLSTRFPNDLHIDYWEARPTGRLLSFNPATGVTRVVADSLRFPNGVALGPGERYVLVCETIDARIVRVWLRGPRAGRREVFASGFPGCLDNLSFDGEGTFWVALAGSRSRPYERFAGHPFLRSAMMRVPRLRIPHALPWYASHQYDGCVAGVDTLGAVRVTLSDPDGRYGAMTSANRVGNQVYVGSIAMTSIARISLQDNRMSR
jgi:sugar lactone lactonase YvrE